MVLWQAMAKRVGTDRQEKYMGKSGLRNRDGLEEGREGGREKGGRAIHLNFLSISFSGKGGPQIIVERKGGGENKRARRG